MNRTLDIALLLARRGFLVFPCRQHDRRPATNNGFHDASSDERQVRTWFALDRGFNLAVATGPQPNGINLVAIDVDPHNGGLATWDEYIRSHDVPMTAKTDTPSQGFHLFFNAPADVEVPCGVSRIGPGIDVRGSGGYVVYPPSVAPSKATGELVAYTTYADRTIAEQHHVWSMPDDLLASCLPPAVNGNGHRAVTLSLVSTGDSVADKAREGWDWFVELRADGWVLDRVHGQDSEWTRPGKDPRLGTSATLHMGGPLVVWSTSLPQGGVAARGGVGNSFSPWDYIVTFRCGGDTRAAASLVRRQSAPPAAAVGTLQGTPEVAPALPSGSLNLPDAFWEARPVLAHIRQAAWAAGCSPDALLVQTLARVATFVHPCFKLPGVEQGLIGKHQTLDFLGCVIAETSGGKTLAAGVGEDLVPAPEPPLDGQDPLIDFDQKVGSGEGIAEFFLVPELKPDDDGKLKPTGKRVIGRQALFMNVDEGTGFTQQAGRKGTTIIATLASAWSGESLGQLNADATTRRLVRGGRVRICAVINMQDTNGYKLYSEELESVGFTGRLLFASAHDPGAPPPAEQPRWPGRLRWNVRPGNSAANVYFSYDPAIVAEIKETRHGILTKRVRIERRQSQYLLLRCKTAALLAVLEDRLEVTLEDWELATQIIAMSAANLLHLDAVHEDVSEGTAVSAATFKMKVAHEAESQHLRQLKVKWQGRLVERLQRKGPLPWKGLKDIVEAPHRKSLRQVLDALVDDGVIFLEGSTYEIER